MNSDKNKKQDILKTNPQIDPSVVEEYRRIRESMAEVTGRNIRGANYTLDNFSTVKKASQPSVFHFNQGKKIG